MRLATERNQRIVSGAIGLVVLIALITVGIKGSFGAFDDGYELQGTFAAAGQGLNSGSSVAIRGVNVGEVAGIRLVDNRAHVRLRIDDGVRIPETASAVIRPKTLFGEKYIDIDPGDDERTGPYLPDGGTIDDTLGGFELERVLADAYPVLEAIDPAELAVVLDELATTADGLGPSIDRQIVNASVLADLGAANDSEFRQFTSDLALLAEELESVAPDVVKGAGDLNVALPPLNERGDQLNAALRDTSRVAGDVADLLEANEEFTTNVFTNGSRSLQTVFDRRGQVQPVLLGLTRYTRTLAEAIRIEVGDGTLMAGVKSIVSVRALLEGHESPPPEDGSGSPLEPVEDILDDLLGGGGGGGSPLAPIEDTVDDLLGGGGTGSSTSGSGGGLLDILTGRSDR
ncbi:MAG TPA: MlaD family protein [Acidimicrobiales bacterium]|nr:MlaD family protein [Acidimicrobiales bacterium]